MSEHPQRDGEPSREAGTPGGSRGDYPERAPRQQQPDPQGDSASGCPGGAVNRIRTFAQSLACPRLLRLIDESIRDDREDTPLGTRDCKDVDDQHPEKELVAPISGYDVPETGGRPQKRQRTGLESNCACAAGQARRGASRRRAPCVTPQTNHRKAPIARGYGHFARPRSSCALASNEAPACPQTGLAKPHDV